MKNQRGFTLIELIVVMGIFTGIMLITSYAFERIMKTSSQQLRSAETETEGIVGLEILRADLEHAGYGLPWSFSSPPAAAFAEAAGSPVSGITSAHNEALGAAPRAIVVDHVATGNPFPGAAYLVIKSTRVAMSQPAAGQQQAERKWAYVSYSSAGAVNASHIKRWGTNDDFVAGEIVTTLSSTFTAGGAPDRRLMIDATAGYSYAIPTVVAPAPIIPTDNIFKPGDASQIYVVYGVDPGTNLRMPYNRADYYIRRPAATDPTFKIGGNCNPGTGILFKGIVKHSDGTFQEYPLLNCVGDIQVDFELADPVNGNIVSFQTSPGADATVIRSSLKTVHVYILAHEGKIDPGYTYPYSDSANVIQVGDPSRPSSSGRKFSVTMMNSLFGSDWMHYRWKVYTIVVRPKNLE
jgi:prepilin-type N-terminal cleavage/methylation domain-containing protein